jgi:hypothetical protein
MKPKSTFLVVTERGRIRGKVSMHISEINIINGSIEPISVDSTFSYQSNRGIPTEAVRVLINKGRLPSCKLGNGGNIDYSKKDYTLIIVEGRGLNYITYQ